MDPQDKTKNDCFIGENGGSLPPIEGVMFGVKFWCEILQTSWRKAELRKETEEKVAEAEAQTLYNQPGKFNMGKI